MIACAILFRDSDGKLFGMSRNKTPVLLMEFEDYDDAIGWAENNLADVDWQIVELDAL